jgi:multiple sugar transport system substrate-binding protein
MKSANWLIAFIVVILATGCSSPQKPTQPLTPAIATITSTADQLTPEVTRYESTRTPDRTISSAKPMTLRIWLPPQFDPNDGSPSGDLLKNRLEAFTREYPNVSIEIRIKALSGTAGLLDSLISANAAAPEILPDLIALPRSDFEVAAVKGLLIPFDNASFEADEDWFEYARQLAMIQGSVFGLPFAGDALVLLYRPGQIGNPAPDWYAISHKTGVLAFPAADPQALVPLTFYQSAGGSIEDMQHRPALDTSTLETMLKFVRNAEKNGLFPLWLAEIETDAQAWQAYREQRAQLVITWASRYLIELPVDTIAIPVPPLDKEQFTLATGWIWAVASKQPEHHAVSMALANYLVDKDFLASWTNLNGYLPLRPSSLTGWRDESLRTVINQVVLSAKVKPTSDALVSVGPVLRDATLDVLKGASNPTRAAETASERLKVP